MERLDIGLADTVALLEKSEFFSRLLRDDLYWLASRSTVGAYADGAELFKAGEHASRLYIIRAGAVVVSRAVDGRSEEMARFVGGDVLGDFDFARGAAYDAAAACAGPAEILSFPGQGWTFADLVRERPDVAARILLRSVAMISSRVRSTQLLISQNAPWVRELRRQMYTDAATGLWSRSYLDEEIPRLVKPHAAFILIKPDRFKELCDTWGHAAGDAAMERLAAALKAEARRRRDSWAIRLKSNETAFVASACRPDEAEAIAATLARAVEGLDLSEATGGSRFRFTASIAIGIWPQDCDEPRSLVEFTYGVLMKAWKDGGNRICRAVPEAAGGGR